ncbi:unnamed protein product, partial [Prorocentrum cordatum]
MWQTGPTRDPSRLPFDFCQDFVSQLILAGFDMCTLCYNKHVRADWDASWEQEREKRPGGGCRPTARGGPSSGAGSPGLLLRPRGHPRQRRSERSATRGTQRSNVLNKITTEGFRSFRPLHGGPRR